MEVVMEIVLTAGARGYLRGLELALLFWDAFKHFIIGVSAYKDSFNWFSMATLNFKSLDHVSSVETEGSSDGSDGNTAGVRPLISKWTFVNIFDFYAI